MRQWSNESRFAVTTRTDTSPLSVSNCFDATGIQSCSRRSWITSPSVSRWARGAIQPCLLHVLDPAANLCLDASPKHQRGFQRLGTVDAGAARGPGRGAWHRPARQRQHDRANFKKTLSNHPNQSVIRPKPARRSWQTWKMCWKYINARAIRIGAQSDARPPDHLVRTVFLGAGISGAS
jgi:hypothetical protein